MDFHAFDLVIGYISGFVGLTLAVSLFAWPSRDRSAFWLAFIVLALSATLGLRAWAIETSSPKLLALSYTLSALLPALMVLLYEERFLISLPGLFKAEVLGFTFLFFATSDLAVSPIGPWWQLGLLVFLMSTSIYFLIILREENAPHISRAMVAFSFACLVLILANAGQFIYLFGTLRPEGPLAGYALLILAHALTQNFFADRPFRIIHELKYLAGYAIFAAIATGLLSVGGVTIITDTQFYSAASLLFAFILAFTTVFTQIVAASDIGQTFSTTDGREPSVGFMRSISRRFYRGSKFDPDQKHV